MKPAIFILPFLLLNAFPALVAIDPPASQPTHWSFRTLTNPAPPPTQDLAWPRNEIDRFILARLETENLQPAPEASRPAWIRRASFDLLGLPPTPEAVDAFVRDHRSDAFERVVDAFLKSPRHGERWAQHWLDVVRYADTHGFEVNTERPNAWPYRDYVIEAFNNDTPYDLFVREQLAGDALDKDAATGFLVTASVLLPGQIGKDEESKRLARQDSLDEIVVNTGQTFLALSVDCARCHDHKFDPISARDYYAMQAFFSGVEYGDRELRTPETRARQKKVKVLKEQVADIDSQLARFKAKAQPASAPSTPSDPRINEEVFPPLNVKYVRFDIHDANLHPTLGLIEPCIDEFEIFTDEPAPRNVALAGHGAKVTASGSRTSEIHRLEHLNDGQYGNSKSWMSDEAGQGWVLFEFPEAVRIGRIVWGRDREGRFTDRLATAYTLEAGLSLEDMTRLAERTAPGTFSTAGLGEAEAKQANALFAEKKTLEAKIAAFKPGPMAFAGTFRKPDSVHLLNRGDPEQPQEEVAPAVPSVLGVMELPTDAGEQLRRLALADWIANPRNPLTARVMVNRVWQGHFGTGLAATPSDFGVNGAKPSHPRLLDWLASEFIRSGWSVKQLHRLIMLSATYRQSTSQNPAAAAKDADVRWLWCFPSRRLESEAIRDSMLAVSGKLNLKMGGRGFDLFNNRGGLSGFEPVESFAGDGLRRMVYAHKVRREREAVFGAFDCPDAGQSTARRRESTTPIQALNLFNSRFTLEQADAFASRVQAEAGPDMSAQIRRAYALALNRPPDSEELRDALPVVRDHGLSALCRALFNSNEFLFLP